MKMKGMLTDIDIESLWEKLNAVPWVKHIHRIEPSENDSIRITMYCEDNSFAIHLLWSCKNSIIRKSRYSERESRLVKSYCY